MPAPAENALESRDQTLTGQILVNHEINAQCRFTSVCAERCILAQTNAGAGAALAEADVDQIAEELTVGEASPSVRHYCMAGKEAFETPGRLMSISRRWNRADRNRRCGAIGAITASAPGVRALAAELANSGPLSWILTSLDAATTGLRVEANNAPLLAALDHAKGVGGTHSYGVNTQLREGCIDAVLDIGAAVAKSDADQWTVGPWLEPRNGWMEIAVSEGETRRLIDRILGDGRITESGLQVTVDLELDLLRKLVGDDHRLIGGPLTWRYEYRVSDTLSLIALNPFPGTFLRVRWDGEMLNSRDFRQVGLRKGSYGFASPAGATELLRRLESDITARRALGCSRP